MRDFSKVFTETVITVTLSFEIIKVLDLVDCKAGVVELYLTNFARKKKGVL